VRRREEGGKEKEIPAHHMLEQFLDEYIAALSPQLSALKAPCPAPPFVEPGC